jgi:hypothetical protein
MADAVDLGRYVCRRCGRCPDGLTNLFRLEGVFNRRMVAFLLHDAEEAALRKVLSHWSSREEQARQEFATAGFDSEQVIATAAKVDCPYGIDDPRKARIAVAKLTNRRSELV